MFKKQFRLTRDKEFERVFKGSRASYDSVLGLKIIKNEFDFNRFGVIVGIKVSKKAVERNKIKRRLREILKNNQTKIKTNYDIIIITQPASKKKTYQELEKSVFFNLKKLRLLKNRK